MAAPLTDEDRKAIDASLADIKEARAIIKRAEMAGIDVADDKAQLDILEAQAKGLKAAFFPTGSS